VGHNKQICGKLRISFQVLNFIKLFF